MLKEFLSFDTVRNNALKLAHKMYKDGFVPDVLYCSLRGGAYMANVISEYYKIARQGHHPVLYAAVVARSYTGIRNSTRLMVDGWTYPPERLRPGDKIMLVDDIFDTGNTVNALVDILMDRGIPREDIKVVVHDYKYFTYHEKQQPVQPDYYCRKFVITKPEEDRWIHYMSHELVGLEDKELSENYYSQDAELKEVLDSLFQKK